MATATLPPCGVYCITCLPTGTVYVGSSTRIQKRFSTHRALLRRGCHDNPRLQNAWNKHGELQFAFALLEAVEDPIEVLGREQHWIDALKAANPMSGFNTAPVAGSRFGVPQPDSVRARSREIHLGKPKSAEHRARISAAKIGTKKSIDELERRSAKRRGRKHSQETIAKMCEVRSGRPQPSKRGLNFEIAEEIRRLRREERISQDKLADRFGCSRKSVREIISWNTYITPD